MLCAAIAMNAMLLAVSLYFGLDMVGTAGEATLRPLFGLVLCALGTASVGAPARATSARGSVSSLRRASRSSLASSFGKKSPPISTKGVRLKTAIDSNNRARASRQLAQPSRCFCNMSSSRGVSSPWGGDWGPASIRRYLLRAERLLSSNIPEL